MNLELDRSDLLDRTDHGAAQRAKLDAIERELAWERTKLHRARRSELLFAGVVCIIASVVGLAAFVLSQVAL
jgi:cytoskeletal protein RodZ